MMTTLTLLALTLQLDSSTALTTQVSKEPSLQLQRHTNSQKPLKASGITDYLPPASISQLTTMPTNSREMKVGEDWLKILVDKIKMISAVSSPC